MIGAVERWLDSFLERGQHDDTAYGCIYWRGDRAGVDLNALCGICGDAQRTSAPSATSLYDPGYGPEDADLEALASAPAPASGDDETPYSVNVALGFALRTLDPESGVRFMTEWNRHLAPVSVDDEALALAALPDDAYFDGTYEWEKDGPDWTPVHAPSGMPPAPEYYKLRRVVKTYIPLEPVKGD